MSSNEVRRVDLKLEAVVIPVSDVDRAKEFYRRLGWRLDADFRFDNGFRIVQFTPPGSAYGPAPDRASYSSFATFNDLDGNGWLLQEVTTRLPGRLDPATTTFTSAAELATALRHAEAAHAEHEKCTGQRDANWPDWYAAFIVAKQAGTELPT